MNSLVDLVEKLSARLGRLTSLRHTESVLLSLLALGSQPALLRTLLWLQFAEKKQLEGHLWRFQCWSCQDTGGKTIYCEWFVRVFPDADDYSKVCVLSLYLDRYPQNGTQPDSVINIYLGSGPDSTRAHSFPRSVLTKKFRNRRYSVQRKRKELKSLVREGLPKYKTLCIDKDTDLKLMKEMLGVTFWQTGIRDESITRLLFVGSVQGSTGFVQDAEIMKKLVKRFVDPEHPGDYAALKGQLRKRKLKADPINHSQPLEQVEYSLAADPSAEESNTSFTVAHEEVKRTLSGERARKKGKKYSRKVLAAHENHPTTGKDLTLRLAHLKYGVHRSLVYRWAGKKFRTAFDPFAEQLVIPVSEIPRLTYLISEHKEKQRLIREKKDVIESLSEVTGKPYDSIKRQFNRYLEQGFAFREAAEKFIPEETLERLKKQANEV